jgi:hypothetical protein
MITARNVPTSPSNASALRWDKLRSWLRWSALANLLAAVMSAALFWLLATNERSTIGSGIFFALAVLAFVGFVPFALLIWLFRRLARRQPNPRIGWMIAAVSVVILEIMAAGLIVWPFLLDFLLVEVAPPSENALLLRLAGVTNTLLLALLSACLITTCVAFARWVWIGSQPKPGRAFPVETASLREKA